MQDHWKRTEHGTRYLHIWTVVCIYKMKMNVKNIYITRFLLFERNKML